MANRTVTVKSSGGDYTSLNAAFAGEDDTYADLVTNTMILTFDCYNFEDTTYAVTGTAWTVSSSYYLKVVAHDSHGGVWSTNAYRNTANAYGYVLYVLECYFTAIGLQLYSSHTSVAGSARIDTTSTATSRIIFDKCIFKGNSSLLNGNGLDIDCAVNFYVANCIAYDFDIGFKSSGYESGLKKKYLNCTAYNCTDGFKPYSLPADSEAIAKNCIAQACDDGFDVSAGGWSSSSSNNLSDIASDAPGTSAVEATLTFVNAAGKNFHLASTDTAAINAGVSLASDPDYPFSDDIDGETRSGTWDIGADEYISAIIIGTTCWGHSTGVTETNTRTFADHGSGTATVESSGDSERLRFTAGKYWELEQVDTGEETITITLNEYASGDAVDIFYRTGADSTACSSASWTGYSAPVESLGIFQIRLEVSE